MLDGPQHAEIEVGLLKWAAGVDIAVSLDHVHGGDGAREDPVSHTLGPYSVQGATRLPMYDYPPYVFAFQLSESPHLVEEGRFKFVFRLYLGRDFRKTDLAARCSSTASAFPPNPPLPPPSPVPPPSPPKFPKPPSPPPTTPPLESPPAMPPFCPSPPLLPPPPKPPSPPPTPLQSLPSQSHSYGWYKLAVYVASTFIVTMAASALIFLAARRIRNYILRNGELDAAVDDEAVNIDSSKGPHPHHRNRICRSWAPL